MALSREVVAQREPKPRFDAKKVVRLATAAGATLLLLVYLASLRTDEVALASGSDVANVELEPDRTGVKALVELAHEQEKKRAKEAMETAQGGQGKPARASAEAAAPDADSAPQRSRSALPRVSDIVGEGAADLDDSAQAWAVSDVEEQPAAGGQPSAASRRAALVAQHQERMLQRRLQALEEAQFGESLRVNAIEQQPRAGRGLAPAQAPDGEASEQYPMRGLNDLSNALLKQSAAQVRAGPAGGGSPLEALKSLAVPHLGTPSEASDDGRAAKNLDFFQHGGDQLKPGYLMASVRKPLSPYELKMGTFVPGILITQIHSESPGQIVGQVSENIYDSATQDHLLFPQGTKVVGTYSGAISIGQERVQVASVQLNFPNGDALDLGGMSVADATGQAGLSDRVNTHMLRQAAATLLSTAATAGYEVTAPVNSFGPEGAVHRALGESIIKLANDMAARSAQIPPTLEIRAGGRFVIMLNKDVVFPGPYQDEYRHRLRDYRTSHGGRGPVSRELR